MLLIIDNKHFMNSRFLLQTKPYVNPNQVQQMSPNNRKAFKPSCFSKKVDDWIPSFMVTARSINDCSMLDSIKKCDYFEQSKFTGQTLPWRSFNRFQSMLQIALDQINQNFSGLYDAMHKSQGRYRALLKNYQISKQVVMVLESRNPFSL